jgi:hypothetical protein
MPKAVKEARKEAASLARAAGLRLKGPIGIARDVTPFGYYDENAGRWGNDRWCAGCGAGATARESRGTAASRRATSRCA